MSLPVQTRRRQRGNAMIEFGVAASLLIPIFAGSFQYGYSYYTYNNLESSVRAAARYAATCTYDSANSTPSAAFVTAVRNVALYGDATGGTRPVAPNLTADNIAVSVTFAMGTPATVTVELSNYPINGIFGRVTLNGKPRVTFPYLGRWDPV